MWGVGCRVESGGWRVHIERFRVQGLGLRVEGVGFRRWTGFRGRDFHPDEDAAVVRRLVHHLHSKVANFSFHHCHVSIHPRLVVFLFPTKIMSFPAAIMSLVGSR